jgi:conjugal transfer mating pair stabilization protein TraN
LHIDIASKVIIPEIKEHWVDDCVGMTSNKSCLLQSQQCTVPASTKILQGIPVTRDCWEQTSHYSCQGGAEENTCKPLQEKGCEQVNVECMNHSDNEKSVCTFYQKAYRCPIKTCSSTTDVICGNGQEYCLDGNCTDHAYAPSTDFVQGVSALSAVHDAAKQLNLSSLTMFAGHASECSEKPIGYSNCCSETGWGQNLGLDHCPETAKQLHKDRENKVAILVGRYCSGPAPFPCIEHNQVFCVFSSKLGKIIQEQGRKEQLHLNFGSAKEPNCRGITPEELQGMDLAKIDFREFADDLSKTIKTHDLDLIQERIRQQVQAEQKERGVESA